MRQVIPTIVLALALLLGLAPPGFAQEKDPPLWVVVTAPELEEALAPLVAHRRAEGMRVEMIRTSDALSEAQLRAGDGNPLRTRLRKLLGAARGARYVLLVGAYGSPDAARAVRTVVPPLRAVRGRMLGRATDHGYGAPGVDDLPTVAVGRFPARSVEEVRGMVEKTLLLESGRPPGPWQGRITLLVGNPGGSSALEKKFAEMFIRLTVEQRLARLPPVWNARVAVNAEGSPFSLPEPSLRDTASRMLSEGQVLSMYLGHSGAFGCDFFRRETLGSLRLRNGGGIFFTCGCYGCEIEGASGENEGYGLAAMRNPGGPGAVIGAYGESYAAMGFLASDGLQAALFGAAPGARLADAWLGVEGGIARGEIDGATFWVYDHADGSGGEVPLEKQRREHLEMWTLLGDPALRLPLVPRSVQLGARATPAGVEVTGTLPAGLDSASVHVTLERQIGTATPNLEDLRGRDPAEVAEAVRKNHGRANDVVLAATDAPVRGAAFSCTLPLPAERPWTRLVVRAWCSTGEAAAQGVVEIHP